MAVTKVKVIGDLLIHCENFAYSTLGNAILRNGTATTRTLDNFVGYPLKAGASGADYQLAVATDEANVIALLLGGPPGILSESIANATNSAYKYLVLRYPPVIINKSAIRTTDIAGASFTVATIVTALEALKWKVQTEPTKMTTL